MRPRQRDGGGEGSNLPRLTRVAPEGDERRRWWGDSTRVDLSVEKIMNLEKKHVPACRSQAEAPAQISAEHYLKGGQLLEVSTSFFYTSIVMKDTTARLPQSVSCAHLWWGD